VLQLLNSLPADTGWRVGFLAGPVLEALKARLCIT
jgi:hypothetical protein